MGKKILIFIFKILLSPVLFAVQHLIFCTLDLPIFEPLAESLGSLTLYATPILIPIGLISITVSYYHDKNKFFGFKISLLGYVLLMAGYGYYLDLNSNGWKLGFSLYTLYGAMAFFYYFVMEAVYKLIIRSK